MTLKLEERFWKYLREREDIRLRRLNNCEPPWTEDWILQTFSFTNVHRIHDRTTTLLCREIYANRECRHPSPVALLNAAISRYFGTIESARANGWHDTWSGELRQRLINNSVIRLELRDSVFTSAYIVPNCGSTAPKHEVVAAVIDGVWAVAESVLNTEHWEIACDRLCQLWGVGSFMAKEVLLDYLLITGWFPLDWHTWTPVGPGARRGAGRVRDGFMSKISESEALDVCRSLYLRADDYWDSGDLSLTDVQFQLCEFDKYERAREGGRPKRLFRPTRDNVTVGGES